jgi:mono/diheme cytochrome c family protein
MRGDRKVWVWFVALAVGTMATIASAQQPAPKAPPKVVKQPARAIASVEGKELYAAYCAACHGKEGRGDGPAAASLKVAPTDLTLLAKKNNGTFASVAVEQSIIGAGKPVVAHGPSDMPVWGPIFFSMGQDQALETMRVKNLTRYLESLQAK